VKFLLGIGQHSSKLLFVTCVFVFTLAVLVKSAITLTTKNCQDTSH